MNLPRIRTTFRSLLALFLLLGAPVALTAAAGPSSAPPPAPQDTHTEFRTAFQKAMEINSTAEMERLVKKHTPEAIFWIMQTAEGISVKSSEELEDRMAALRKAWRGSMDSDFCDNMYEYFSLLEPIFKKERGKAKERYDKANKKYWDNLKKKDGPTFGSISIELRGLAKVFADLGDYYFASECWLLDSNCWNEENRGKRAADLYKLYEGCDQACMYREKVDLKDRYYIAAKSTRDYLKAQGFDGDPEEAGGEGPGAGPPKGGVVASAAVTTCVMTFEMVPKFSTYQRPCYYADELYNMWNPLSFAMKGSSSKINSLGKLSPMAHRVGSAEVLIDADGDGEGEVKIPLRGNLDPVEFTIGKGEEERPWGVLTQIGTQQDVYQGVQMNMQPTDDQMQIYLAPGASMVGEVDGIKIRVFDDNMDGIYGSDPLQWGHVGMTPGNLQPEMDSVVIGDSKRAVPWSEYLKIGDKWYVMQPAKFGQELGVSEAEVETGKVKLSFKGGKPSWIILQGAGLFANSYFDVVDKKNELPAGDYKLFYGELRKGKKLQMAKTLIIPGENTRQWEVVTGKTTTVQLGGPFGFDFNFDHDAKTVHVEGNTVAVIGVAGERYERPWNCVPRALASWRKEGSKKGSKPEKMGFIKSQDELTTAAGGWSACWFPFSVTMPKKGKAEDVQVQLTEKKNKLFGKIESEWRGK